MRNIGTLLMAAVLVFAVERIADAQLNNTNNNNTAGTAAAGNVSGQTGQSDNFTIQRDTNAFIGGSTTNFLGGAAAAGGGFGGLGGGLGGLGGLGGFGRGNTGFGNQGLQQNAAEPRIRFRITLGFSHPRPAATKVGANFALRLTRIPHLKSAGSVAVTMEDRTAVLAGQVESEHEKMLMEKLAMMEPGVSEVRNELTVKEASETLPQPGVTN